MTAKFKIFYQNTRGLRTKIARGLREKISLLNFNIIALTETWLNENFSSESIFDHGLYTVHRSDRTTRTYTRPNTTVESNNDDLMGGGCLIATNKNIPTCRMSNWENEVPYDNVWLKIGTNCSSKLFINCIYINCRTTFELFNQYLEHLHDVINIREPEAKFIILGDFNLSCIEWYSEKNNCIPLIFEGRMATELINTLTLTDLIQINTIKNSYNRILDLLLANFTSITSKRVSGLVPEDPYHPAISFKFESLNLKFMKPKQYDKLNFFKADYNSINHKLESINWQSRFLNKNVDEAVEEFYKTIFPIVNKFTPKSDCTRNNYPNWYSIELIQILKEKEFYYKLMKKYNCSICSAIFKEKRRKFKNLKKKCLRTYESNIESFIKSNPRSFFSYTKTLQKSNQLPSTMRYNNSTSIDMKQTANLFADYFESVYTTSAPTDFHCNNNCNNYMQITNDDIIKIINSLDQNKSNSPDGLPIIFYKNTLSQIIEPLVLIFKLAITQMQYPTAWKISHITPIHKSGDKADVKNYRPISVLSAIAKIFDRILHNYIQSKTSHLISSSQHGFTAGKSTVTNLLEFVNYITDNMMNGGRVDVIFMDLAKAFDKIAHDILLKKLKELPVDPCLIVLLQSYLKNRKQIVCIDGEKSKFIYPNSSVPQGSVLSPLLFALFINDLPSLIKSKVLLFADDLKIFLKIETINDTHQLQKDIDTICDWCNNNKLIINKEKCNSMTFTRRILTHLQYYNYNINGTPLSRLNSIRDLGIIFDSKLSFEQHYKHITTRAYKILGFISRSLNKFTNIGTYMILYNTYVRSILDYGSIIWSPYYDTHINTIEKVQRRFTRVLFRKFHYPTEPYMCRLVRLQLMSLENRRLFFDELSLYKIYNGIYRTSLRNSINLRNRVYATRSDLTFHIPFVNNNVQYYSPILRIQRQHNETFNNISMNEECFNAFKRYVHYEIQSIQSIALT